MSLKSDIFVHIGFTILYIDCMYVYKKYLYYIYYI